jgi:cobalt/nickel transport protein
MKVMNRSIRIILAFVLLCLGPAAAMAHFGAILPSDDIVTQEDSRTLSLELKFIHPMERQYMEMDGPRRFGVLHGGQKTDLLGTLRPSTGRGADQDGSFTFWAADFQIRRPGDYTFYVEPTPYWEAAEDRFIVHYTKVCVNAMGLEQGWDEPVGLETEIIPYTRPYGLWTGNLFTGQVLLKGRPVAYAEVEIEYLNEAPDGSGIVKPPSGPFVTQLVKADKDGVFSYAMPRAGWWGFAALNEADRTLMRDGVAKEVELGAVYWVRARDMK